MSFFFCEGINSIQINGLVQIFPAEDACIFNILSLWVIFMVFSEIWEKKYVRVISGLTVQHVPLNNLQLQCKT